MLMRCMFREMLGTPVLSVSKRGPPRQTSFCQGGCATGVGLRIFCQGHWDLVANAKSQFFDKFLW